jgi:hypothetical protein
MFCVVPERFPKTTPWDWRHAFRILKRSQTSRLPPLMRKRPSGSGQMFSFTAILAQYAVTVATDETKQCGFDPKELRLFSKFDRQMKEQMAMNDVRVGLALATPHGCQATGYPTTNEVFVETFADLGEALAVRVIEGDRARPVDRDVSD